MKKFMLVAHDYAPSSALHLLTLAFPDEEIEPIPYLGFGQPQDTSLETIAGDLLHADAAIVGMSSGPDEAVLERLACHAALAAKIPLFLFAESFDVSRPWFREFIPRARILFVNNNQSAAEAKRLYPELQIAVSGNPEWEEFYTRQDTLRETRAALDLRPHERLILCVGTKSPLMNGLLLGTVIEAVSMPQIKSLDPHLVFTMHPGDATDALTYQRFADNSRAPLRIVRKYEILLNDVLSAADLYVGMASSVGVHAACLRIPAIDYLPEVRRKHLERITGKRTWPLCDLKASVPIYGSVELFATVIGNLIGPKSQPALREQQIRAFPGLNGKLSAIKIITEAVLANLS